MLRRDYKKQKLDILRVRLFIRQGGLCHWCGSPMSLRHKHRQGNQSIYATLDHLVRKADGGTYYHTNIAAAHGKCNSARHGKTESYQEHLRRMKNRYEELAKELEFKGHEKYYEKTGRAADPYLTDAELG